MLRSILPWFAFPLLVLSQNKSVNNFLGSTPASRHVIGQKQALLIQEACAEHSASIGTYENIAIVDPSGFLVSFLRTDNAYPGSVDLSIKKARAVALFNGAYTTNDLYNMTQPGGVIYGMQETNGGLVVWTGGYPIFVDGYFIGALGVSGGTGVEDLATANAGLAAIGATEFAE